eukprot:COSAG02_NODE_578_length_20075_cov_93.607930_9_plen_201_part_00
MLKKFKPQLEEALAKHKGLKVYPAARCFMSKTLAGEVLSEIDDFYVSSGIVLRFLDSQAFLNASLDTLVKNLYEGGKGRRKFVHSAEHCIQPNDLDLLLKKGVYPYDYMSAWDRFEETKLPAKKEFYKSLCFKMSSDGKWKRSSHRCASSLPLTSHRNPLTDSGASCGTRSPPPQWCTRLAGAVAVGVPACTMAVAPAHG